jgi:RNA recognition motif-containing protein
MVGPIDKVIMGLNQVTRMPCGFAFVIYFSHKAAQSAASYITGTKLDNRYIRVDVDWGFQTGREFGRGKTGGQVRLARRDHSVLRVATSACSSHGPSIHDCWLLLHGCDGAHVARTIER